MNRRAFLSRLTKTAACFTILPSANRVWKATAIVRSITFDSMPNSGGECYWTWEEIEKFCKVLYDLDSQQSQQRQWPVLTFYDTDTPHIIQPDQQLPRARTLDSSVCPSIRSSDLSNPYHTHGPRETHTV